ncbi:MAG: tyrosine-type recombinase/integrase [bacterium]|nr:tyrosine-type recombinase/integrase [bacterium]
MPRPRLRPIDILSPNEVQTLIATASSRAPSGIRNRALIAVLYFSGIRLAESLALAPRDVDLEAGEINVRCGKGGRQRLVGINVHAQAHLSRWMDTRERLGINGRQPVFCTFSKVGGEPRVKALAPRYVQLMLHRLADRSPLEKRIHPHGLRHSHAVHLLRRGVALPHIQRQLGHRNLATTDEYLRGLGAGEHVAGVRDLEW